MTTALLALAAAVLGATTTLTVAALHRHRARVLAFYRGLAALRGCKHARTLSRPHLSLVAHGRHVARGRDEPIETREAVAA
jgi:hypothetical protein